MGDLISRSALLAEIDRQRNWFAVQGMYGAEHLMVHPVRRLIEDAPAVDAVEVVRCKDCKRHYDSKFGYVVCVWFNKTVRADGYCSYGCKMDAEVEGCE